MFVFFPEYIDFGATRELSREDIASNGGVHIPLDGSVLATLDRIFLSAFDEGASFAFVVPFEREDNFSILLIVGEFGVYDICGAVSGIRSFLTLFVSCARLVDGVGMSIPAFTPVITLDDVDKVIDDRGVFVKTDWLDDDAKDVPMRPVANLGKVVMDLTLIPSAEDGR